MNILKRCITITIINSLLITPIFSATRSSTQDEAPKEEKFISNAIIKVIKKDINDNFYYYYPEKMTREQEATAGDAIIAANNEILEKLKDDSFSFQEIREDIYRQVTFEEKTQLDELAFVLQRMDEMTMNKVFKESMKNGKYHPKLRKKFLTAQNVQDKKMIIYQMISTDLSNIKTTTIKRLGMATRQQLIDELELTNTFFVIKGSKWRTIAFIALTVAVAGLTTWAIISGLQRKYAKKTEQMNEDYDNREDNLEESYRQRQEALVAEYENRERLREEGYVWQVCNQTETQESASCSYDYQTHSGKKVCITHCLKNPETGAETNHVTSCSSAFIPNNCFMMNPYEAGFNDGESTGYSHGYEDAYEQAYREAYYENYNDAYDRSYSSGYDSGYSSGYSDGISEAEYDDTEWEDDEYDDWEDDEYYDDEYYEDDWEDDGWKSRKSDDQNRIKAFKKGYKEGYAYAQMLKLGQI